MIVCVGLFVCIVRHLYLCFFFIHWRGKSRGIVVCNGNDMWCHRTLTSWNCRIYISCTVTSGDLMWTPVRLIVARWRELTESKRAMNADSSHMSYSIPTFAWYATQRFNFHLAFTFATLSLSIGVIAFLLSLLPEQQNVVLKKKTDSIYVLPSPKILAMSRYKLSRLKFEYGLPIPFSAPISLIKWVFFYIYLLIRKVFKRWRLRNKLRK